MLLVAPPSPDYIPGPEEPQIPPAPQDEHELMFMQPHDPDFVPEPIYPEYTLLEDKHILLAEEQPLPPVVSPTAESLGYVAKTDPEEYENDETEDGSVDHPIDGGDKPIIPLPSTDTTTTGARITIRPQTSISLPPEAEFERLLAMPTPSPSPLTSLSPPSAGERSRTRISQRVAMDSQQVDLHIGDRMTLKETVWIVEEEAYAAREAWAHSVGLSQTIHHELQTLREQIQQTEIAGLRETDRVQQSQIVETLRVMRDMRREMGDMQAELLALRGQPRKAGQPGRDVIVPNH
uniref:Reverse transcriptase domain-containing protein n=1 Tax=Tanacetum cinerariifolium TaxID=118510 RepID=A0A6L2ME61_TANCI|nr:hypothetical protein [Tanacetum cinerariifolium]